MNGVAPARRASARTRRRRSSPERRGRRRGRLRPPAAAGRRHLERRRPRPAAAPEGELPGQRLPESQRRCQTAKSAYWIGSSGSGDGRPGERPVERASSCSRTPTDQPSPRCGARSRSACGRAGHVGDHALEQEEPEHGRVAAQGKLGHARRRRPAPPRGRGRSRTAIRPTAPVAPRTSTVSPRRSAAMSTNGMKAAAPEFPTAAPRPGLFRPAAAARPRSRRGRGRRANPGLLARRGTPRRPWLRRKVSDSTTTPTHSLPGT